MIGSNRAKRRQLTGSNRAKIDGVQDASIPPMLLGNYVVVAAETGSGKTHGYLVALFHKKLCKTTNDSIETLADGASSQPHHLSLVLCPNVMLCEQVVRMANCICHENGEPLLTVADVCGRQGWPGKDQEAERVGEGDLVVKGGVFLSNKH